jgi:histidine ammonia-lyase
MPAYAGMAEKYSDPSTSYFGNIYKSEADIMKTISLGVEGLTLEKLVAIARSGAKVQLTADAEKQIQKSRHLIERWVQDEKRIYGITTGFGALSDVAISKADTRVLQKNILMSHSAGVGRPFDEETVKAILALRIKDLARLLNWGVCPLIPEKGSVGASGDLAPLAHLSLVLIGLGEAFLKGQRLSGRQALSKCGLKPLQLEAGEGGLAVYDAGLLAKLTDIAAAMSLEVLMGSRTEFDPKIHQVRPHPGQAAAADNMARITQNSEIITSHKDCAQVQDAYTLRCSPQVHGATRDAIRYCRRVIETEMNSSTNNPLVFADTEEFLLGGNFHGQPVAMAMDFLGMAISELADISERRIERLVNPMLSGLPAFLVDDGGLNSGLMLAQYTAAALVSENKVLCHPASIDSIPTSANKEDHVSMGTISARKCRDITRNAEDVIAIELLSAAQALDLFTNMKPGEGTLAAYQAIRQTVSHLDKDRIIATDIAAVKQLMRSGKILNAVEKQVGTLQ